MLRTALIALSLPLLIGAAAPPQPEAVALAPAEIVAASPAADWATIDPADLLVMDLAADAAGRPRRVVIQLLPPPFAQGWIGNIRALAAAHWWDGTSINRAQDNYVVQWGDPDGEDKAKAKPLPPVLRVVPQTEYEVSSVEFEKDLFSWLDDLTSHKPIEQVHPFFAVDDSLVTSAPWRGWPVGSKDDALWPVHCYGTVGVGRDMPPDTGSGAELYAVIGHAPRQLDRNIAVIGRVIEGMEHLSTLPRGTGDIGFYKTAAERTPIRSIRIGSEVAGLPVYQYLSTESASFARYADARANRRDPFYIRPAGGADICNIPVPVRRKP